MSDAESKQIERMKSILADQQTAFRNDRQRSLTERKADLAKIAKLCRDNVDAICEAINKDFSCRADEDPQCSLHLHGHPLAVFQHSPMHLSE